MFYNASIITSLVTRLTILYFPMMDFRGIKFRAFYFYWPFFLLSNNPWILQRPDNERF